MSVATCISDIANELRPMTQLICRGLLPTSEPSLTAKFVAVNSAVSVVGLWAARNPLTKSLADKLGFLQSEQYK